VTNSSSDRRLNRDHRSLGLGTVIPVSIALGGGSGKRKANCSRRLTSPLLPETIGVLPAAADLARLSIESGETHYLFTPLGGYNCMPLRSEFENHAATDLLFEANVTGCLPQ
jgi:hypothetical protein